MGWNNDDDDDWCPGIKSELCLFLFNQTLSFVTDCADFQFSPASPRLLATEEPLRSGRTRTKRLSPKIFLSRGPPLFQLRTEGDLGRGVAPATKDGCAMMNKRDQSFVDCRFSPISKREGFAWIVTKENRWFSSSILLSFLFSFGDCVNW